MKRFFCRLALAALVPVVHALVLDDFAGDGPPAWEAGGWQGKATPFTVGFEMTPEGALQVDYVRHAPATYFHLLQRGQWDLSGFSHFRMDFKGTELEQRISLHLLDADGNWSHYGDRGWWCEAPGAWQRNEAALDNPAFPRTPPYADLSRIVYIAFQIRPTEANASGTIYVDNLEFYQANPVPNGGFEDGTNGWNLSHGASIDNEVQLGGDHSLRLARDEDAREFPSAASDTFPLAPGRWQLGGALRSQDLLSPDVSYNVSVTLEALDGDGKVLATLHVTEVSGTAPWRRFREFRDLPEGTTGGRLLVAMNKTYGTAWIDDLSMSAAPADKRQRPTATFTFTSPAIGNLYLPDTPLAMTVDVDSRVPLAAGDRVLRYEVRDYWGVRQAPPQQTVLTPVEVEKGIRHRAELDLGPLGITPHIYHELHVSVPALAGAAGFNSFAILPPAAANEYPPERIPFGTQGWSMRSDEAQRIGRRLGCAWARFHWHWPQTEPDGPIQWDEKPDWELQQVLHKPVDLGYIPFYYVVPGIHWERNRDYQTLADLRRGMRESLERYGNDGLRWFKLGNEPPGWDEEIVRRSVNGYEAMYRGVKDHDPDIPVISTSINNNHETFLRLGTGKWCDIIDIHIYRDIEAQRELTRNVIAWAKKYGTPRPLWCSELGTKGMGLTRRQMAVDCISKQVVFFADGGYHVDWFALQATERQAGTFKDAFAMVNIDGSPRLDAIAHYNLVNSITVKTFVDEKAWDNGAQGFLFRDDEDNCALFVWATTPVDVALPIEPVGPLVARYLDGRGTLLHPDGAPLTVSLRDEPLILTFRSAARELPTQLAEPALRAPAMGPALIPGQQCVLDFATQESIALEAPRGWPVDRRETNTGVRFSIDVPVGTRARTARFFASLPGSRGPRGELLIVRPMADQVEAAVQPLPGNRLQLTLRNNSLDAQTVDWQVELVEAAEITAGVFNFDQAEPPIAAIDGADAGEMTIRPQSQQQVQLQLTDVDRQTLYRVRAEVGRGDQRLVTLDRWVGGFVGVPRAATPIRIDGDLNEAVWAQSPVLEVNEARQFWKKDEQTWDGPADLSATIRVLWDDENLYLGVRVRDDVFRNIHEGNMIWAGDGLQFLLDPWRDRPDSEGFYDYLAAHGQAGDQFYCGRSADRRVPIGALPAETFASKPAAAGGRTYELAIPWSRVLPFAPTAGRNLGFSLIVNEDDGQGRFSFLNWFSGVSMKKVAHVGDLILLR